MKVQLLVMDTDSASGFAYSFALHSAHASVQYYNTLSSQYYFAFATDTVDEAVLADRKQSWEATKSQWIADPQDDFAKRTPLLFKYEYQGKALVALAPKVR